MIGPARKNAAASRLEQLKLHRFAGFLLDDDRTITNGATGHEVADSNFDYVAAPKLAVDGEVEQRPTS